jgi:hypothetical protein
MFGASKARSTTLALVVAGGVAGLSAGAAGGSPSKPKYSGSAVTRPQGYSAEAKARTSGLARVRVKWDSGVTVKFGSSATARDYGGYQLSVGNQTYAGFFSLPAGSGSGSIQLTTTGQPQLPYAPLRAVVKTGTRPTLVVTGFPAGTTELQMSTGAAGSSGTRMVAPCRDHVRRVRGSMLITLASGAHEAGLVDNGLGCGLIKHK